ncbi:hypothetical protein GCM10027061_27620 [Nesterenkonia suensis]
MPCRASGAVGPLRPLAGEGAVVVSLVTHGRWFLIVARIVPGGGRAAPEVGNSLATGNPPEDRHPVCENTPHTLMVRSHHPDVERAVRAGRGAPGAERADGAERSSGARSWLT